MSFRFVIVSAGKAAPRVSAGALSAAKRPGRSQPRISPSLMPTADKPQMTTDQKLFMGTVQRAISSKTPDLQAQGGCNSLNTGAAANGRAAGSLNPRRAQPWGRRGTRGGQKARRAPHVLGLWWFESIKEGDAVTRRGGRGLLGVLELFLAGDRTAQPGRGRRRATSGSLCGEQRGSVHGRAGTRLQGPGSSQTQRAFHFSVIFPSTMQRARGDARGQPFPIPPPAGRRHPGQERRLWARGEKQPEV